ncbi:MAG: TIGR03936 family radical SAM-associated protein [Candidatus Limnocylindria bacterium]
MDATTGTTDPEPNQPATPPVDPARQRWRLVVARAADARRLAQRETVDAWLAAIAAAGLPLAKTAGASPRPRLSLGAPLPMDMPAEAELIDIVLTERWPAWRVREALEPVVPEGWQLVRLEDVWLGGPPLAGRVAAADYRIALAPVDGTPVAVDAVRDACTQLLQASTLPRARAKGDRQVSYDLRPLLIDVRVVGDGPPPVIVARTRFHPELGNGRPEEVVAALGDALGVTLEMDAVVRARLLLVDDLHEPGPG